MIALVLHPVPRRSGYATRPNVPQDVTLRDAEHLHMILRSFGARRFILGTYGAVDSPLDAARWAWAVGSGAHVYSPTTGAEVTLT